MWLSQVSNQSIWNDAELILIANSPSIYEMNCIDYFKSKWANQFQFMVVERESLYKSWNRCLDMSNGKYIAIANVDDIRNYDGLKLQVEALEKDIDALFCFAPYYVVKNFGDQQGRLVGDKRFETIELTRSMLLGPFFIWRRIDDFAIKYFDEQLLSGGDFDFAVRIAIHGRGVRLPFAVGYYLDAGTGLSTGSELQPVERTLVDLRYGIYDKLDYDYLSKALMYNIKHFTFNGQYFPIGELIPEYENLILQRQNKWLRSGMKNYLRRSSIINKLISNAKFFLRILSK